MSALERIPSDSNTLFYKLNESFLTPYNVADVFYAPLKEQRLVTFYDVPADSEDTLMHIEYPSVLFPTSKSTPRFNYACLDGNIIIGPASHPFIAGVLPYRTYDSEYNTVPGTTCVTLEELQELYEQCGKTYDEKDWTSVLVPAHAYNGGFMAACNWGINVTEEMQYCHLRMSPTMCDHRLWGFGGVPNTMDKNFNGDYVECNYFVDDAISAYIPDIDYGLSSYQTSSKIQMNINNPRAFQLGSQLQYGYLINESSSSSVYKGTFI